MDRPVRASLTEGYFFLGCFLIFGVYGAGGEDSSRLSASSARFRSISDIGGMVALRCLSILMDSF